MMWSNARSSSGGKPSSHSISAAHAVVAERDLPVQPAGVGHRDRAVTHLVGLELADVVEQRAGNGDVAVDAGERRGDRADGLGHGQGVLEQAVRVGLVVVLGRGRDAEKCPAGRALAEDQREQAARRCAF